MTLKEYYISKIMEAMIHNDERMIVHYENLLEDLKSRTNEKSGLINGNMKRGN